MIPLTYAGLSYMDRTYALETGQVKPKGVNLNYVSFSSPGDLFRRQSQYAEFEASEMSASTFIMMISRGDDRFIGIPVFLSRNFRHSQVYVNARSGIEQPPDLIGKNVGVLEYQMTAALWIRAFLQHDYGVKPEDMHWWTGGLTVPGYVQRLAHDLPAGLRLEQIPADQTLEGMLDSGDIDALVTVRPPEPFLRGSANIRRLFPNYWEVERSYFLRTGYFPIMHLVVIRRDVYERHRWIAASLLEAFTAAREVGWRRLRFVDCLAVSLPWLSAQLDDVDHLFGGNPFPYGLSTNHAVLDGMTTYSYEQSLSVRKVNVSELFAHETLIDPMPL
jgi:4,5-dihydroxyphthalate decarboxylase